ncbi:MAG: hypothetical protein ACJ71J_10555 [Nitrososphaeraceae archaeon]
MIITRLWDHFHNLMTAVGFHGDNTNYEADEMKGDEEVTKKILEELQFSER